MIDRIAILLDGEILSAPIVNSVPLGKDFVVDGLHKSGEVQNLANALTNPLESPLIVTEMSPLSAEPANGKTEATQGR